MNSTEKREAFRDPRGGEAPAREHTNEGSVGECQHAPIGQRLLTAHSPIGSFCGCTSPLKAPIVLPITARNLRLTMGRSSRSSSAAADVREEKITKKTQQKFLN